MFTRLITYLKGLPDTRKQFIKFVAIGIFAVLVDMTTYFLLLQVLPELIFGMFGNEPVGKSLSFLTGTVVTYNLNKHWTWRQKDKSGKRVAKFGLVYGLSLGMNVLTNNGMLYLVSLAQEFYPIPGKYMIAFITATGVSAVINFAGQKLWVFGNASRRQSV